MANVTFDKKQLPQVAALGGLSACLFGYFGFKMITPPAIQAAPPAPASGAGASTTGETSSSAVTSHDAASDSVDPSALIGAAPPSAAMRDPFSTVDAPSPAKTASSAVSSSSSPKILPALAAITAQQAPKASVAADLQALPGASAPTVPTGAAPIAAVPQIVSPATQWSVSGVICSDINPALSLAIFRDGNVRRYVKVGEWLDNNTELLSLDRSGVVLKRSGLHFRLPIGGTPDAATAQPQIQPQAQTPQPPLPSLPTIPQQPAMQQRAMAPAPDYPLVTIAQAEPPAAVVKVGDSVQVTSSDASDFTNKSDSPPLPNLQSAHADQPGSGPIDVPAFNSDLPAAQAPTGELSPASFCPQGGAAPLSSMLLAPCRSDISADAFSAAAAQPLSAGLGMKLVSTPSSVLQALGIDNSLFMPQAQANATAPENADDLAAPAEQADADVNDPAIANTSVFRQYDAVTASDMAQIACMDQPKLTSVPAPGANSGTGQADTDPLSALTSELQQNFQPFVTDFTS